MEIYFFDETFAFLSKNLVLFFKISNFDSFVFLHKNNYLKLWLICLVRCIHPVCYYSTETTGYNFYLLRFLHLTGCSNRTGYVNIPKKIPAKQFQTAKTASKFTISQISSLKR